MKKTMILSILLFILCKVGYSATEVTTNDSSYFRQISGLNHIEGKPEYLASPFVTAGDRVYMVGFQDGSFPDLGWHIDGEMGGIWDHPIKLMDGFTASVSARGNNESFCLNKADKFINYPMANEHHFYWEKEDLTVDRFQFVPDKKEGIIVEYRFINQSKKSKELVFSFTGMTDLRPTWLGERTNMIDGTDSVSYDKKLSVVIAKDKFNPWYLAFGSSLKPQNFSEASGYCQIASRKGLGKDATLSFLLNLKPGEEKSIPFFIAGSYKSKTDLLSTYNVLLNEGKSGLKLKIERYNKINRTSHITIPDKGIEQMYEWLKYNTDWLIRDVPEIGTGISAGLPDYPWWFGGDAAYSLQGVLAAGDHELVKNSIILLDKISQKSNGNGRIIHEVSTNGSVYNPGLLSETALFITLVKNYYEWTGDNELVKKLFPQIRKGIKWLLDNDTDGNGYPNGNGLMEIPGLDKEMIDVAAYTQQALASAAELALAMGDKDSAGQYQKSADELKAKINSEWWNSASGSYGDFRGTVAEARPILTGAIIRADTLKKPWVVVDLKEAEKQLEKYPADHQIPYVIYRNWVVNTPLETGVADFEKGKTALETAKKYENPYGVYVTGIDRTEEADSVILKSRKKTFSYTGAVMTIPTGVQAVAAAKYGKPEDALRYIKMLQRSFSYALPGSMYEVSPDFGMVVQAWNCYGVDVPLIHYFFGIKPEAFDKTVFVSPNIPTEWKDAAIENVPIGNNLLSLAVSLKDGYKEYSVSQTLPGWKVIIDVKNAKKIIVNDRETDIKKIKNSRLVLSGKKLKIVIYQDCH
jgi:glycogen debranching enzyme